jgi:hyperosmotically inducible protein
VRSGDVSGSFCLVDFDQTVNARVGFKYPCAGGCRRSSVQLMLTRSTAMRLANARIALVLAIVLSSLLGCAGTATKEGTGEYVDDAVITTKVKAAIFNEPSLKSAEINVETFKGTVQLSGFVNSRADINKAVDVARGVQGVTSVKNDMRLK